MGRRGCARSASRARRKRPALKFIAIFALLVTVPYVAVVTPVFKIGLLPPYLRANATACAALLRILGEDAHATGTFIASPRCGVQLVWGCDAILPAILFASAVLAFPAGTRGKIAGLLIGIPVLLTVNLIRVVSLFYIRIYVPTVFETMHIEVWQALFVMLAAAFWTIWAWRATRAPAAQANACA